MEDRLLDSQPVLGALHDLLAAYTTCVTCLDEVIGALVAADPARIRSAIAAQSLALKAIDAAEMRRRLAVRGLVHALTGALPRPEAGGTVTMTALLRMLPPERATPLRDARHELLMTLHHLQTLQQRAATLAQSGLIAIQRTINVTIGSSEQYGAGGARALPQRGALPRQGRWA